MPWDPYLLEARLALDEVRHRNFPAIAADALEAGYDGPTIRRIAALTDPSSFEVAQLRPAFMREAGLRTLMREEALLRITQAPALKSAQEAPATSRASNP